MLLHTATRKQSLGPFNRFTDNLASNEIEMLEKNKFPIVFRSSALKRTLLSHCIADVAHALLS